MRDTMSETPFRIYVVDDANEPVCVCATDDVSLGEALVTFASKIGVTVRGIMYRPVVGEPGEWLVNPWESDAPGRLSRATTTEGEPND